MALDQGAVATSISLRRRDGSADVRGHRTGLALASIVTRNVLHAVFFTVERLVERFNVR